MLICSNSVLVERRKIVRQEMSNIEAFISKEQLEKLFEQCSEGTNTCMAISESMHINFEALNALYTNYVFNLQREANMDNKVFAKEKAVSKDAYFDTKKLIKKISKLTVNGERFIKAYFVDTTFELHKDTIENRKILNKRIYDEGHELVNTLKAAIKKKGAKNINASLNENFYYTKWRLYFSIESEMKDVKKYIKENAVDCIVSENTFNYKELNSKVIPADEIKRRVKFIKKYHDNNLNKQGEK